MKATLFFAFLLLATAFAQESSADSKVVHLTRDNITQVAYGQGLVVVLFFAPWCPHCQAFRPIYEKFASQATSGIIVADVDCTQQPYLQDEFGIIGYPTILIFSGSNYFEYHGARTVAALNNFVGGAWKYSQPKPLPEITPTPEPVQQQQQATTTTATIVTTTTTPQVDTNSQPQPVAAANFVAVPAPVQNTSNTSNVLYNLFIGAVILMIAGVVVYFYSNDGKSSPKELLKLKITKYFSYEQRASSRNDWANDDAFIRPELA
eukprot:CAMPEP_0176434764 /NCGR_PEP_ID=MMETSP0127-20121128/16881_1 /TAXON_ID=938130 /ORGANISM="Platyophrya macrostoma, Strain WH" /LENGTH=262 /DNA_ID=CAMNT_0017817583 /DNA_START=1 /DNA_END=789 /DNA_ORIENTATION=-